MDVVKEDRKLLVVREKDESDDLLKVEKVRILLFCYAVNVIQFL